MDTPALDRLLADSQDIGLADEYFSVLKDSRTELAALKIIIADLQERLAEAERVIAPLAEISTQEPIYFEVSGSYLRAAAKWMKNDE